MKYIARDKSIITGKRNLEHLYTIKDFPVFISYVEDKAESSDMRADLQFGICPESGVIQLEKVLPLDIVYQAEHSTGMGKVWGAMYEDFAAFIAQYPVKNVLEIGGGNGVLAQLFTDANPSVKWTMIDPLPLYEETEKVKVIKGWFDEHFIYDKPVDAIVHSHTLEHLYDPSEFLQQVYKFLKTGNYHLFSVPNLYRWLQRKYTNSINFEHTIFLTEDVIDYLVQRAGFKIIDKKYHHNHSIFYAVERLDAIPEISFETKYDEYKKIFEDYIEYHKKLITELNAKMKNLDCDIYVFGAHIFSQFLFEFGLDKSKITGIIDNSEVKQHKRLYGTPFTTYPVTAITSSKKVAVILKAAEYQEEIRKQLLSLKNDVIILE